MSLTRVAVVTGAAQGIGRAIALRLAADHLDVAVNDIASKTDQLQELVSQIQARGGRSLAVPADISNEDDVQKMIAKVVETFGGLDAMVANAGIVALKPLIELSSEDFDKLTSVNLRGVMLCYKHAAIQMIQQGRGGRILGMLALSAYSATKFAVRGLTQSAALELAKHNITDAILPKNTPIGEPEVIASLVSYLIKPEAYFITGQTIMVNGGLMVD
ncbi:predicted protein [Postia placenta Mad-698-R]|uniref:NAD(P)-binding protein n=1 Tax=Postia placenta MAD-698-R-SB12 TaxID=670580 RepID=A0A1X6MTN3_9APHY|nr:hypothetical protein POSPLADRAFT_1048205 [Postia placenta MAD-698-R-SB12]EED83212.1 predicted protein [Postia placenta Mad-698-R]OSX59717.1 hypothetical protein POSPLADRAFT_1048205 [Postia placenta MAD-698-R-SB12]